MLQKTALILTFFYIVLQSILPIYAQETPPQPIKCVTTETCNYNSKDLENFVAEFYGWYVQSLVYSLDAKNMSIKNDRLKTRENTISNFLANNFAKWYKSIPEYDTGEKAVYFCARDYDPIFCRLYIPEYFIGQVKTKVTKITKDTAQIIVYIPESLEQHNYPNKSSEPIKIQKSILSVWLKVEDGTWKIARIREWPVKSGGL